MMLFEEITKSFVRLVEFGRRIGIGCAFTSSEYPIMEVGFMPKYIEIGNLLLSQTLLTSLFGTTVFLVFTAIYLWLQKKYPYSRFVQGVNYFMEYMIDFFKDIGGHTVSRGILIIVVAVFFYLLRSNLLGLLGDFFVMVIPQRHVYFRPIGSDFFFNLSMAVFFVIFSNAYGFYKHGFGYIEKYIPYKGMGIVTVTKRWHYLLKPLDILLGLAIGLIELVGEFGKMLSLSLRLLGNIMAGMILMGLIIAAAQMMFHVPFLLPLVVFLFELLVSFIQAFVFSLLVLLYFRLAGESHH